MDIQPAKRTWKPREWILAGAVFILLAISLTLAHLAMMHEKPTDLSGQVIYYGRYAVYASLVVLGVGYIVKGIRRRRLGKGDDPGTT
jgi:hypothetical protein